MIIISGAKLQKRNQILKICNKLFPRFAIWRLFLLLARNLPCCREITIVSAGIDRWQWKLPNFPIVNLLDKSRNGFLAIIWISQHLYEQKFSTSYIFCMILMTADFTVINVKWTRQEYRIVLPSLFRGMTDCGKAVHNMLHGNTVWTICHENGLFYLYHIPKAELAAANVNNK